MKTSPLSPELLHKMDAYWRAANYLSVGQIYLYDNPLLKKPLELAHVKPIVVGHWGTTPARTSSTCTSTGSSRGTTSTCSTSPARPRRPGPGSQYLLGGHLQRDLPQCQPGRGRAAAALQAVLVPRRHFQPRGADDAGVDPRGGELGYSLSHAFGLRSTTPA